MFAGDQSTLGIDGQAVGSGFSAVFAASGVTGRFEKGFDADAFVPANYFVLGDVAEQQVTAIRVFFFCYPDGAFDPVEAGGEHFYLCSGFDQGIKCGVEFDHFTEVRQVGGVLGGEGEAGHLSDEQGEQEF